MRSMSITSIHPDGEPVDTKLRLARDPQSPSLKIWHQLLLTCLIYEVVAIPFIIAFDLGTPLQKDPVAITFYFCEVVFLIDFYVKLSTGFDQDGAVVHDLQQSRRRYLKSREFPLDIVSIIPYAALPVNLSVSKMILEAPKILRLHRLPGFLSNVDDVYVRHFELLKLSKLLVGVTVLSHYVACVRFSFGYDVNHDNHWLPTEHDHQTVLTQYLQSMFWAFGLLTGLFEGELPHSIKEFAFTIVVAVCGFSVFTYLCATFFLLSKCESNSSEVAEARITQLKHILTFHHVPDHVRDPLIEYLRHYYAGTDTIDREVTKLLCPSIRRDVQVELLKGIVAKIPVFAGCSPEFIEVLSSLLERITLPAQSTLFSIGDYGDAMYIIHTGVLDVIGRKAKIRELRKNDYVGELSLFSNFPRSASVVTSTYCVLYKLSRFHTELVLGSYPNAAHGIKDLVTSIIEKTQLQTKATIADPVNTRPEIKRRQSTEDNKLSTVNEAGTWSTLTETVRRKSSTIVPFLVRPSAETAKPDQARKSITLVRPPRLLHRVLSMKRRRLSDAMKDIYDELTAPRSSNTPKKWWHILLLKKALDCSGIYRVVWVFILQVVLIYNWCLVPLQIAFPALNNMNWLTFLLNGVADVVLWADIYINFNLAYMQSSERIQDPTKSAVRYFHGAFVLDLVCTLPYDAFVSSTQHCLARLPRLLRFWRASGHFREVDAIYPLRSKHRLLLFAVLLFLLIHIESCLYFSVTFVEGFSHEEEAWLPHDDIELHRLNDTHFMDYENVTLTLGDSALSHIATMQYMRSFYFATHKLTGLGKGVEPNSDLEYLVGLMFMFSGFVITAVVVDNVQKRFTASAHEEKEFFAIRSRIQSFLRRQNASAAIYHRVNVFLEFWWAAHRGATLSELLCDLPGPFQREVKRSIYTPAFQSMALLTGVRPVLSELENTVIEKATLMLYGQGECIFREGDNVHGLYILLEGRVSLCRDGGRIKVSQGGYFGTQILRVDTEHLGYDGSAIADSGCVVLVLSRAAILQLRTIFPLFTSEVMQLKERLLHTKIAKSALRQVFRLTMVSRQKRWFNWNQSVAIDPDSTYVFVWEVWLFIAMTVQWVRVLVNICFGVKPENYWLNDGVTIGLELSFLVEVHVRSRLGYREFGNKIMDLKLIHRRYFRSWYFAVDVVALMPLFMLNWLPGFKRWEIFNINKVLRLMKVPNQFRALEQRYIKVATELRLVKLIYYTFISTHILGCIYFDFASHASGLHGGGTSFGENAWALPTSVEHDDPFHQYFAANFWAFGVMSASNTGELPETTPQCALSIVTQVTGFFLFAYVIGNFSNIIELANAEHREFNAKMGPIRHLLGHYSLPRALDTKVKMLLFFKRFHSIAQEEVLEHFLPPSLMTDIRLFNLKAMIENVPFLKDSDSSITRMLVAEFKQVLMIKDEYVYKYNTEGSDMFFVFTGILTMFSPLSSGKTQLIFDDGPRNYLQKVRDIHAGDFFGENALFEDLPRNSFVRARTSCVLYSLSRHSLDVVFELHPNWRSHVLQAVQIQQQQQEKQQAIRDNQVLNSFHSATKQKGGELIQQPTTTLVDKAILTKMPRRRPPFWLQALSRGIEAQSSMHITWLRVVIVAAYYVAFMLPSCVAFEACREWDRLSLFANLLEVCCFVLFTVDIWINLRLKESELTTELYEVKIRDAYRRERLLIDIIAALPIQYVFFAVSPSSDIAWFSMNRCLKVLNVAHYMNEIYRQSVSYEGARLQMISLLYILIIYWGACAYLRFADHEGYSSDWDSWFPSTELDIYDDSSLSVLNLRLFRGLFFAVTAFMKKGRTFMPEGRAFVFAVVVCFVGLMVMAFMIGEIANLYISSIDDEVHYRKNHIAVEHTMSRWKVSATLNARVRMFLSNLWSSHRGVVYQDVFATLPSQIREEMMLHIVDLPLQAFIVTVFRPIMQGDTGCLERLTHGIVANLCFASYPTGERVVVEGRLSEGLFFVISGKLVEVTNAKGVEDPITHYTKGDYFGERGVLTHSMCETSVQTQMPSELFVLSADNLESILRGDEFFSIVVGATENLFVYLRRKQSNPASISRFPMPPHVWDQNLRRVLQQQRLQWALGSTESETTASTKGEVLWTKMVTSVLDANETPLACLQLFKPFIEMLGPKGELFDRSSPQRRVVTKASNSHKNHFRRLVHQIGVMAVTPILQRTSFTRPLSPATVVSQSVMSSRSSISKRLDSSKARFFTESSKRRRDSVKDMH